MWLQIKDWSLVNLQHVEAVRLDKMTIEIVLAGGGRANGMGSDRILRVRFPRPDAARSAFLAIKAGLRAVHHNAILELGTEHEWAEQS